MPRGTLGTRLAPTLRARTARDLRDPRLTRGLGTPALGGPLDPPSLGPSSSGSVSSGSRGRTIRDGEPVAVFGDYDVDGAASVALIERFLRAHGQSVATYIPDRLTEGYGPSPAALEGLAQQGAHLILTVD